MSVKEAPSRLPRLKLVLGGAAGADGGHLRAAFRALLHDDTGGVGAHAAVDGGVKYGAPGGVLGSQFTFTHRLGANRE